MIGLFKIGATMGQITYNQLKREQTMNKQHTFCFKIKDVSKPALFYFLNKASENHLFEDIPEIAHEFFIGCDTDVFNKPRFFTENVPNFEDPCEYQFIGIDKDTVVVMNDKIEKFGDGTVFIKHPYLELLEHHLNRAAPNKQEQKTTEAPKGDEIVQLFQTADGRSFKTRAEAEYHRDRARLIEKLADDTGCAYDDAEKALNWLEANHPRLKED